MSDSYRDRLDLEQLRRQGKELRDAARAGEAVSLARVVRQVGARGPREVTLAVAQLVIARELGFTSWPKLKAAVESRAGIMRRAAAFVTASVDDRERRAQILLEADPRLAGADIRSAAVVGDARLVEQLLAADPSAANAIDRERGWPPLLYVCYSRWHRIDPGRAAGMVDVARLLLDAGASPDANNGARPHHGYRSALHGSVTANNPGITRLLLERSANPNDGESLYQAAGHRDHECMRLLLNHDATVAGSWAVDVAVGANDAEGVRLLLDAAKRQTPERVSGLAGGLLARACAAGAAAAVEELLAGDAKPSRLDQDGLSPLRRAVRAGHREVVAALLSRGVTDDATHIDRFLGATARGDRSGAELLLSAQPDLRDRLSARDRAAIVDVAGRGAAADAVRLMIELGFSPDARNIRRDASARRRGRRRRGDGTPAARARRRTRRTRRQLRWHTPRIRDRHQRRAPQHERRLGRHRPTPTQCRRGPNRRLGRRQATERRRRRGAAQLRHHQQRDARCLKLVGLHKPRGAGSGCSALWGPRTTPSTSIAQPENRDLNNAGVAVVRKRPRLRQNHDEAALVSATAEPGSGSAVPGQGTPGAAVGC